MTKLAAIVSRDYRFNFVRWRSWAFAVSAAALLASAALLATRGLDYGIDFKGGLLVEVRSEAGFDIEELRGRLSSAADEISLQSADADGKSVLISALDKSEDEQAIAGTLASIKASLGDNVEYRRVEMVGPRVGEELKSDSGLAAFFAILVIVLYVWFRFEWQFALGALVSLFHDALITLGLLSLCGVAFDLTTVAAVLTLIGYSINDTVVEYDRMRENLRKHRRESVDTLINRSINDCVARTLLTGITTLAAAAILLVVGGDALYSFSFVLFFGILIGTYSSVYIAMPMLSLFDIKKTVEAKEREAA
ncbi:hypothetical protein FACS1894186_0570 [Alphaproteobacteria bacterium]|nr:hypothetical protein FACS1894186_0570 [Alphaproteobacteria bacterium]